MVSTQIFFFLLSCVKALLSFFKVCKKLTENVGKVRSDFAWRFISFELFV